MLDNKSIVNIKTWQNPKLESNHKILVWFGIFHQEWVKIEFDIDFVQFDFNRNIRIKITYTINSKYAYKLAPRSTY